MQRAVMMITEQQRRKLNDIAKREHVSVAEINRRAIDQYFDFSSEQLKALDVMADCLGDSNKRAEKALAEAEAELSKTLKHLRKRKS